MKLLPLVLSINCVFAHCFAGQTKRRQVREWIIPASVPAPPSQLVPGPHGLALAYRAAFPSLAYTRSVLACFVCPAAPALDRHFALLFSFLVPGTWYLTSGVLLGDRYQYFCRQWMTAWLGRIQVRSPRKLRCVHQVSWDLAKKRDTQHRRRRHDKTIKKSKERGRKGQHVCVTK